MKKLIIANWKMNPVNSQEASQLFASLKKGLKNTKKAEVVVCPPFVYLSIISNQLSIKLGAQDCFWEDKGAFTGEVSVKMLKDLGCSYVIVGHSERRQTIGESDTTISKKIKAVVGAGLRPILCVGETREQRKKGSAFRIVEKELNLGLSKIKKAQISKVIIAYEPIWAIGTGASCSVNEALTAALFIRKVIGQMTNQKTSRDIKVLYGGSVKANNAADYLAEANINGLLVGEASLDLKEFAKIIKMV